MKKFLIASGVAVLAFATVVSAQGYAFNTNLTVGSTGADVVALQSFLIAQGYSIPAISAGTAAKGYFGSQTKTAVMKYQAAKGIPNTGFVGPLTRGALNGSAVAMPSTAVCPVGFTCTPVAGTQPVVGQVTGITAGTDGSVSVADSSFVSSGQTVKKGETKDVAAVRLQATAGAVAVTRFDVHFSVRPWLFFSQVTLKDSAGKVLATKPISSSVDATEVTVGSDYLVRFEGLNYIVAPGVNPDLAVGVTVLAATDKIPANGQSVYVAIPSGAIRTVNGLGITESVGGAAIGASTGIGARLFTLNSSGSVADITTRIAPASAASTRYQTISSTTQTSGVVLGVYGFKSANNSSTLQSVSFSILAPGASPITSLISNVRLVDGSSSYGSTNSGSVFTISNVNIALAQDQWKDMTLVADIAPYTTDITASSTLLAASTTATDSNYNSATISGSNVTASDVAMTVNAMSVSNLAVNYDSCVVSAANGPCTLYPYAFTFTLTNNSNSTQYLPKDVTNAISSTTNPSNATSTITGFRTQSPQSGDTTSGYAIQSGASRTFTIEGSLAKSSNAIKQESARVTAIKFSTTAGSSGSSITSGLETLEAKKTF